MSHYSDRSRSQKSVPLTEWYSPKTHSSSTARMADVVLDEADGGQGSRPPPRPPVPPPRDDTGREDEGGGRANVAFADDPLEENVENGPGQNETEE